MGTISNTNNLPSNNNTDLLAGLNMSGFDLASLGLPAAGLQGMGMDFSAMPQGPGMGATAGAAAGQQDLMAQLNAM